MIDIELIGNDIQFKIPTTYTKKVIYGIPKDTSQRKKDDEDNTTINNAQVLWYFEHGSPAKGVEGRPLLGPVRDKYLERIKKDYLNNVANALMVNNKAEADEYMKELALFMQEKCVLHFRRGQNEWRPNAKSTIDAWARETMKLTPKISAEEAHNKTVGIWSGKMKEALRGVVINTK